MDGLGIISDDYNLFVFPVMRQNLYYCLAWGNKRGNFGLSKMFSFYEGQKLLGPQELTAWLD